MRQVNPTLRRFAQWLVTHDSAPIKVAGTPSAPSFSIFERLRHTIGQLTGNVGYRALLLRAKTLAAADVPWLRDLQVNADCSLDFQEGHIAQLNAKEVLHGTEVLLLHFLELLDAFIGEELTMRLMRGGWPELPPNDPDFGKGAKNENAE